jgi:hypothetical protein
MARWSEGGWRLVGGKGWKERGMEEAPENGKELLHSAHANGRNIKLLI